MLAIVILISAVSGIFSFELTAPLKNKRIAEGATIAPLPIDPELQVLSEAFFKLDQAGNAAFVDKDWAVNTRSSNGKLFTKFNKDILKKPTYAALVALLNNYEPVLGIAETVTAQEKALQSAFLDAIIATPVMSKAWEYLKKKNLAPSSAADFKTFLQKIWFTIYRRRGQMDSSGFEHVFVGEITDSSPEAQTLGFHNWIQLALEEAANRTFYEKWKGQNQVNFYGMQFRWQNHLKIKSTMAIGESPEMSMAVLTTCFLVAPNNQCQLKMGGVPVNALTYRWDTKDPQDFYVATAYYD